MKGKPEPKTAKKGALGREAMVQRARARENLAGEGKDGGELTE